MQEHTHTASRFRLDHSKEMQGVRALAVAAVFLYHVDHTILPGGFLGVDIFFVVSGFLIGRILLAELDETGTIALLSFAAGRARRLLPNAFAALLFSALAALVLVPSYRLSAIGDDIWSAALLYSNLHFARNAIDYLQIGEPPSPLLHFLSLSIEEQFYLGLPVSMALLAVLNKKRRIAACLWLTAAVMVISFLSGLHSLQTSKPDAFFLTHNRIWQLAVGVIAGWGAVTWAPRVHRGWWLPLFFTSTAVILTSIFLITPDDRYPGFLALFPTIGAAVLLFSIGGSRKTPIHHLLAARPAQWVGDRSYSIYLWHWPFIAIMAEAFPGNQPAIWLAATLSLAVASLAFSYIEQPIRKLRRREVSRTFCAAAGAIASVVAVSLALSHFPLPADATFRAERILAARRDLGGAYDSKCHLSFEATKADRCDFAQIDGSHSIMLFGDSHAAQWFAPIRDAASNNGWRFSSRTKTSCPSPEVAIWYPPKASIYRECAIWRSNVMAEIKSNPPNVLVLSNNSAYSGWIAEGDAPVSDKRAAEIWETAFTKLMDEVPAQTEVWLIRDNPEMFTNFQACLSYNDDCKRPRSEATSRLVDEAELATHVARKVKILDFTDRLCDEHFCHAVIDGAIAYRDSHHLTSSTAARFTEDFKAGLAAFETNPHVSAQR